MLLDPVTGLINTPPASCTAQIPRNDKRPPHPCGNLAEYGEFCEKHTSSILGVGIIKHKRTKQPIGLQTVHFPMEEGNLVGSITGDTFIVGVDDPPVGGDKYTFRVDTLELMEEDTDKYYICAARKNAQVFKFVQSVPSYEEANVKVSRGFDLRENDDGTPTYGIWMELHAKRTIEPNEFLTVFWGSEYTERMKYKPTPLAPYYRSDRNLLWKQRMSIDDAPRYDELAFNCGVHDTREQSAGGDKGCFATVPEVAHALARMTDIGIEDFLKQQQAMEKIQPRRSTTPRPREWTMLPLKPVASAKKRARSQSDSRTPSTPRPLSKRPKPISKLQQVVAHLQQEDILTARVAELTEYLRDKSEDAQAPSASAGPHTDEQRAKADSELLKAAAELKISQQQTSMMAAQTLSRAQADMKLAAEALKRHSRRSGTDLLGRSFRGTSIVIDETPIQGFNRKRLRAMMRAQESWPHWDDDEEPNTWRRVNGAIETPAVPCVHIMATGVVNTYCSIPVHDGSLCAEHLAEAKYVTILDESTMPGAGRGLAAAVELPSGYDLGNYTGLLEKVKDWKAPMTDPLTQVKETMYHFLLPSGRSVINAAPRCASVLRLVNDPRDAPMPEYTGDTQAEMDTYTEAYRRWCQVRRANCEFVTPPFGSADVSIRTIRVIQQGEELLACYGYSAEMDDSHMDAAAAAGAGAAQVGAEAMDVISPSPVAVAP
jgi:hypothetical protein